MSDPSETRSLSNSRYEFRKEMVVKLRGILQMAFIAAGWKQLMGENQASGARSSYFEDDQIITDLAKETLGSFMLNECPGEEDRNLKTLLEAEMRAFLNTILETNRKNREQCITFMNKMLETFSFKYQRKLNTFLKITSNVIDESYLQSFHTETTLKLLDEYDGAEKLGNTEIQNGYRENILERFDRMYSAALNDQRKIADETRRRIKNTIAKHCEDYSRLLNQEARRIHSITELGQIEISLTDEVLKKFKTELSFLGNIQYNFAKIKLKERLFHVYQNVLTEISSAMENNRKICQQQLEAGVEKYKSEMKMVIQSKPISTDQADLSIEHQRVFESVLSDFDSRLTNEDDSLYAKDIQSNFKQKLEVKLLNKFASFENEWETNRRMIQLEILEHLSQSSSMFKDGLQKIIGETSKLEEIVSCYKDEAIMAAEKRFSVRFPNLSQNYRQEHWEEFVSTIHDVTVRFINNRMEAKYENLMRQSMSQNPFVHGEQLRVLHDSILTCHFSHLNDSLLSQQQKGKIENVYKIIQIEQEGKVSPKLLKAEALSEKLLQSFSLKILRMICEGSSAEEIEDFRKQNSQEILEQYKETISWAQSTNSFADLLGKLELGLNSAFEKAKPAIEQLEIFYNEYYGRKDISSESTMIPPEICQKFHDNACISAILKCIEEKMYPDEEVFKKESKTFLDRKYKERLADATVIGIDFGMDCCKSAVYVNGKIQMIPHYDESGEEFNSMASYVGVGDCDGLVGQHAKSIVEKSSEFRQIIWDSKSNYIIQNGWWVIENYCTWKKGEKQGTISMKGIEYLTATAVSKLFHKLKKNAEKFLNHSVKNCVVTVDQEFNEFCKGDIVKAAELAGFTEVTLLDECDSAVLLLKHIVNLQNCKTKVLFLEFGLVFRFYVLEVSGQDFTKLSSECRDYYGFCFLHYLVEHCIGVFCTLENVNRSELNSYANFNYQKQRIIIACQKAIESLSVTQIAKISISNFYKGKDLCADITVAKMEEILNSKITDALYYIGSCIRSTGLSPENIDEVIISGGFSGMPVTQKNLKSFFNGRPMNNLNVDPVEVIAHGAAIKGALLAANRIREGQCRPN